jgi:polygalacturonase
MDGKIKLYADGIHDDTASIQAMLDQCGTVRIPDGRYLITKPLIIHSNTHLILSSSATLRLADGANCSLLDNDGLYSDETNVNITVEGGIWDGNHMAQERQKIPNECRPGDENEDKICDKQTYIANIYTVFMVRLVHTEHLQVKNLTFKDPTSYAIHIADSRYFNVENVTLDYDLLKPNMDGVHIQGPARFGKIRNVFGNANDDHVALCANGTIRSEITRGDIEDVDIDGIYCDNGYTGVRLLSRGDAIRNVHISNIHGEFRFYAVSLTHHYPIRDDKPILLENIRISDVYASKSRAECTENHKAAVEKEALIWLEKGIVCRNVTVENVYRNERNIHTKAPTVRISEGVTAENLQIKNVKNTFVGAPLVSIENNSENIDLSFDLQT